MAKVNSADTRKENLEKMEEQLFGGGDTVLDGATDDATINDPASDNDGYFDEVISDFDEEPETPEASETEEPDGGDDFQEPGSEDEPQSGLQEKFDKLQHKHNVLKGMMKAEAKQLAEQLTVGLQGEVEDLKSQVEELSSVRQVENDEMIEGFREEYGDEFADNIQKTIQNGVDNAVKPLKEDAKLRKQEREKEQMDAKKATFFAILTEDMPEWKKVCAHPEYKAFEDEIHPMTGKSHNDMMWEDIFRGDTTRTVTVLNDFRKKHSIRKAKPKEPVTRQQRVSSTTPPNIKGAKSWSPERIKQVSQEIQRGDYAPGEAKKLRAEMEEYTFAQFDNN